MTLITPRLVGSCAAGWAGKRAKQRRLWVLAVSKRFAAEVWDEAGLRCELLFSGF